MDYCKKIDKYISLYLDELLDDKAKLEFLKHIDECSQCSAKFKEVSYVVELCRENQDIQLPENFSSSLHERFLEISQNESKNKILSFVYNKRFIAGLSTAAILVVSLLAYSSLPHMGLSDSTSMVNDTVQVETSSAAKGNSDKSKIPSEGTGGASSNSATAKSTSPNSAITDNALSNGIMADSTLSKNKEANTQTKSNAATQDADINITSDKTISGKSNDVPIKLNKSASTEEKNNSQQARLYQDKAETSSNNKDSEAKQEKDASCYTIASKKQSETDKYFSNYAELNLKVSKEGLEIENLRKLMNEICAIELKPVTINNDIKNSAENSTESSTENSTGNSAEATVESPQYVDYYLPLSSYSTLKSQATNYTLELSTKTDIINSDTTDKYNTLNTQNSGIDKKIADALKNGENASELENEKTKITGEINKLISEKEMITVRVFFTP